MNTRANKASNVFYVTDAAGNDVDLKVIEAVRREIGQTVLQVKEPIDCKSPPREPSIRSRFSIGNLFGRSSQVLYNLGLIRSFS